MIGKSYAHIGGRVLLRAQGRKCFYCGQFMAVHGATRDHLWPKCKGNKLPLNHVFCCRACNLKKGCRIPSERELAKARVLYVRLGAPAFVI